MVVVMVVVVVMVMVRVCIRLPVFCIQHEPFNQDHCDSIVTPLQHHCNTTVTPF
jgi:hypothetical protein